MNFSRCITIAPKDFVSHYNDYDDNTPFPWDPKYKKMKKQKTKETTLKTANDIINSNKGIIKIDHTKNTKNIQDIPKNNNLINTLNNKNHKNPPRDELMNLSKKELKEILSKRGVRVYYHDTLEILRKKCIDSEEKKGE